MPTAFENALNQLNRAVALRPTNKNVLQRLSKPEREHMIHISVQMDDGNVQIFEGYRVQYSNARGPYKGGIRFHPATDIEEVRALAFWMTMKTAVANIPMGGGKGGVTVDAKALSHGELERLARGWVDLLAPDIGPERDVPAPDVHTTPEIMQWMADEYARLTGDTTNATFTGKPLEAGGSEGRDVATGYGGYYVFDALRESLGIAQGATVAIQGIGNVGSHAADIFSRNGYKVIALSDSKSALMNDEGLKVEEAEAYKKEHGSLAGFPGAKAITNEELLLLNVDVLIPAALESQLTAANAKNVQAKLVLELANGPTTPEADDLLFARGIPVIPDILANAGGVIVSSFEWQQNRAGEHWSREDVLAKLHEILTAEAKEVYAKSRALSTDLRRAAFVIAIERLETALLEQNPSWRS